MTTGMSTSSTMLPSVMIVGDAEHADFCAVRSFLRHHAATLPGDASTSNGPQHLLLFQARPGQTSQCVVERAYRAFPLAKMLAIVGSWCEGEMRSGQPWHGVERVYWYNAVPRLMQLFREDWRQWSPRTETPAERIERSLQLAPPLTTGRAAAIVATTRAAFEPLADACGVGGFASRWVRNIEQLEGAPELILWDVNDAADPHLQTEVQRAARRWTAARRVVLAHFPRHSDVAHLHTIGATEVLGKPLQLTDLLTALGSSLRDRALVSRSA